MTSKIAAYGAKKVLGPELTKYANKKVNGDYDPLFEMRPDKKGRMKKCKKLIPAYIPEHDALILAKVRKRAYRLDMSLFELFGLRFGWSSVIGIIPAIGDGADMAMALLVYRLCNKVDGGLDSATKIKMLLWIIADFFIGIVPFIGDLLDAAVKCNTINCRLLERHLDAKYKPDAQKVREKEKRQSVAGYLPPAPATVYEDFDDNELEYNDLPPGYQTEPETLVDEPIVAAQPSRSATGRTRLADEEMGLPAPATATTTAATTTAASPADRGRSGTDSKQSKSKPKRSSWFSR